MNLKQYASSAFLVTVLGGCATSKPISISTKPNTVDLYSNYDEDLSAVRPRYKEPTPIETPSKSVEIKRVMSDQPLHINRQLDVVVDTIAAKNRTIRFATGYRIQIYVGNTRQEADDARLYTYQTFPELNPYLVYSQPTYRVRIGDFMTKIEAERYLQLIRNRYETSVIIPEKIELKKSLLVK